MGNTKAELAENGYIKELFAILKDNDRDTSALAALLDHVGGMENYIKRTEAMMGDMKKQIAEMKEVQNHPIKSALKNTVNSLEKRLSGMKEMLGNLKDGIVEGCKNAVKAFKEKGITALSKLSDFFFVREKLADLSKNADEAIKADNKSIAKIEAFSEEYHKAGRNIGNMFRVLRGKEPIDRVKEQGRLSRALSAPYREHRASVLYIKKMTEKAVTALDRLERGGRAEPARNDRQEDMQRLSPSKENRETQEDTLDISDDDEYLETYEEALERDPWTAMSEQDYINDAKWDEQDKWESKVRNAMTPEERRIMLLHEHGEGVFPELGTLPPNAPSMEEIENRAAERVEASEAREQERNIATDGVREPAPEKGGIMEKLAAAKSEAARIAAERKPQKRETELEAAGAR
jgi:uncharacterized protein YukE